MKTAPQPSLHVQTTGIVLNGMGNHASLKGGDTDPSTSSTVQTSAQVVLEERVRDLEEKLATLSLLLQRQRRRNSRSVSPPSITPPASPPRTQDNYLPLESPAPLSRPSIQRQQRNLSFRVLHSPDSPVQPNEFSDINDVLYFPGSVKENHRFESLVVQSDVVSPIKESDEANSPSPLKSVNSLRKLPTPLTSNTTPSKQSLISPKSEAKDKVKSKWLDYLNSFQESNYDTDKQMEEFVKVPSAVEALLSYGFWICVDSFLYILAILPIRAAWSCLLLLRFIAIRIFHREVPEGPFRFHRRHSYQLIQLSIIYIVYKYALMPISIGKFYHWIRGQNMVKLYLLIAIVEVFDRLMCSLGQDCLDSLYWNTTRRPRSSRLIVSVVVVLTYAAVHSFLLFVHVATLNVAMNSDDQALISLLIGGNFAEIKSTVFKKYNKANLFKITASDICERFKLALFLALVLLLNLSQGLDEKMVMKYVHMFGIVWCAEWLADWLKHAFITKFNFISSHIYPEYGLLLAGDVTGIGHEGVNIDHSHAVVKRIGFAQLPLVCVMARYLKEAFKYVAYDLNPSNFMIGVGMITVWSLLLICKLFLGSFLQKISLAKLKAAPEFSSKNAKLEKKE